MIRAGFGANLGVPDYRNIQYEVTPCLIVANLNQTGPRVGIDKLEAWVANKEIFQIRAAIHHRFDVDLSGREVLPAHYHAQEKRQAAADISACARLETKQAGDHPLQHLSQ